VLEASARHLNTVPFEACAVLNKPVLEAFETFVEAVSSFSKWSAGWSQPTGMNASRGNAECHQWVGSGVKMGCARGWGGGGACSRMTCVGQGVTTFSGACAPQARLCSQHATAPTTPGLLRCCRLPKADRAG
jgi:hypothetical protein